MLPEIFPLRLESDPPREQSSVAAPPPPASLPALPPLAPPFTPSLPLVTETAGIPSEPAPVIAPVTLHGPASSTETVYAGGGAGAGEVGQLAAPVLATSVPVAPLPPTEGTANMGMEEVMVLGVAKATVPVPAPVTAAALTETVEAQPMYAEGGPAPNNVVSAEPAAGIVAQVLGPPPLSTVPLAPPLVLEQPQLQPQPLQLQVPLQSQPEMQTQPETQPQPQQQEQPQLQPQEQPQQPAPPPPPLPSPSTPAAPAPVHIAPLERELRCVYCNRSDGALLDCGVTETGVGGGGCRRYGEGVGYGGGASGGVLKVEGVSGGRCGEVTEGGPVCTRRFHFLCAWFAGAYVNISASDPSFTRGDRGVNARMGAWPLRPEKRLGYPAGMCVEVRCLDHSGAPGIRDGVEDRLNTSVAEQSAVRSKYRFQVGTGTAQYGTFC